MPSKTIIFHAGAPKTGSTSLQRKLGTSAALLAPHGVRFLPRHIWKKNAHSLHRHVRDLKNAGRRADALTWGRTKLAKEFETADVLIFSNEDALFDPKVNGIRTSLFQDVDHQADRLKSLFEGYHVICFFTLRDWQTWLPSNYFQMVRQGETRSLSRFVATLEEEDMDWRLPIAALNRAFGRDSVFYVTHESLCASPSYLYQQIIKAAGLPDPGDVPMPAVNKTYGIGTISYMRFWNWVFGLRQRSPRVRRFIRQKIYPYLTYWLKYTPVQKLDRLVAEHHAKRYQDQVMDLEEMARLAAKDSSL